MESCGSRGGEERVLWDEERGDTEVVWDEEWEEVMWCGMGMLGKVVMWVVEREKMKEIRSYINILFLFFYSMIIPLCNRML